jgi:hypothetical protein
VPFALQRRKPLSTLPLHSQPFAGWWSQSRAPPVQAIEHAPWTHTGLLSAPYGHGMLHPPQWFGSDDVS